jgi:hypothetical protein
MKNATVISNARDCFIELLHRDSDPLTWIVRRWTKVLWFKKRVSSDWFNDERQALAFAHELRRGHDEQSGRDDATRKLQNAEH